ncbi:insulin-like 3 (Leydig cell) isoform X1 [Electrophorus electricus]|nr:insulin-like 3 (Leydig cell) isoform X1 [Electrophorus electricus]
MVVMSCGSSRMARYAPDSDRSHGSSQSGNWRNGFGRSLLTQFTDIQHSEEDQGPDNVPQESVTNLPSSSHMEPPEKKTEQLTTRHAMSASARSQRDAGPAGVCCRLGCTMSEFVQYC